MKFRRTAVVALVLGAALLSLAGCGKSSSVTSPAGLDNTAPAAPSNLVGLYDGNQQRDYLIWTASSSASAASYEVWQYSDDPANGNAGTLVGTVASGTSYFVLPAPADNVVMNYRMRTRSSAGTPSAFSACIHVQRHGASTTGSSDPDNGGDPIQTRQ